ncbi:MAG: alkaline phosphatase PhoX [Alphaproteobacteria bacterium]
MKFTKCLLGTTILTAVALSSAVAFAGEMSLTRIATMPAGAEVTGLSVNGLGELFLNAQHPGGKNAFKEGVSPALLGYIAGFDSRTFSGSSLALPGDGERGKVNVTGGNYVTFAKAGDKLGDGKVLGGVYNTAGELMYVSNAPDYNGFIPRGANSAYLYTAWEGAGREGAGAVSRLSLSRVDGKWQADANQSKMIDLSSVDGGQVLCSGIVTPWGTPLLAEEYFFFNTAVWNHPRNHDADEKPGYAGGNDITYIKPKNMSKYLGKMANPYRYGYMLEINNAASENGEKLVKHYATGRLSHETAAVMPDMRTVYMSDDDSAKYNDKTYNTASGGVLFKFIADRKGDLSAGTLYAAKLTQDDTSDPRKAGFNVDWVMLGQSNNAQIASWIAEYDNVKVSDYVEGQTNYISNVDIVNWAEGLTGKDMNGDGKVGSYKDDRPAFLESRRAAAALGATNEWDKLEGVTSNANMAYVGASSLSWTMDKTWGDPDWITGKRDETKGGAIALDKEDCGGVYVAKTGADYNITRLDPYVIGKTIDGKKCDNNLPANPDNILTLADGSLLIGEDAGKKKHPLDMLWMVK